MKAFESMSISEFMSRDFKEEFRIESIEKRKRVTRITIKVGLATSFIIMSGFDVTIAAGTGIDDGAGRIYSKLLEVGKWVIIIKGGISTINFMIQDDATSARKAFFSYLIVYAILHGLPWGMNQVDDVFRDLNNF